MVLAETCIGAAITISQQKLVVGSFVPLFLGGGGGEDDPASACKCLQKTPTGLWLSTGYKISSLHEAATLI